MSNEKGQDVFPLSRCEIVLCGCALGTAVTPLDLGVNPIVLKSNNRVKLKTWTVAIETELSL